MARTQTQPPVTVQEILRSPELNEPERHRGLVGLFDRNQLAQYVLKSDARARELEAVVSACQEEAAEKARAADEVRLHGQVYVSALASANGHPPRMKLRDLHTGRPLQKDLPVERSLKLEPFQIADVKDGVPDWTEDKFEPNCAPALFLGWVADSQFPRAWVLPHTPREALHQDGQETITAVSAAGARPPMQVDCPTLNPRDLVPNESILDVDFQHGVCAGLSTLPPPAVREQSADSSGPFLQDVAMIELVQDHFLMQLDPTQRRLCESLGIKSRPLLVYSEQGTGKSTLLNALANTARLEEHLGPAACIYQGCASDLLDSLVGATERKISDAFNNDLVLIDEAASLLMRRNLRANTYAGAHRRSFTETILSAISGTIADHHRRHPRPGRQLETPVVVFTVNAWQDEVTESLDAASLDRMKLVRFSPFTSADTYARYAEKLLGQHLVC